LLLAWGSPELDVLALTVVAGNAPLADTARNAARLVAVRRLARPPLIALGTAVPLRRPLVTVPHHQHGADGLGEHVPLPNPLGATISISLMFDAPRLRTAPVWAGSIIEYVRQAA